MTYLDIVVLDTFLQSDREENVREFRHSVSRPSRSILFVDSLDRRKVGVLRGESVAEGGNVDDSDRGGTARLSRLLQERKQVVDESEVAKVVPLRGS